MAGVATFSWSANWADKVSESVKDMRKQETLGRSMGVSVTGFDESLQLLQEVTVQFTRDEAREFMAFWSARRGAFEAFKAPSQWTPGTASKDAPHVFDDASTVGLVRFSDDKIGMKWLSADCAETSIGLLQVKDSVEMDACVHLYRFYCEDSAAGRADEWLTEWCAPVSYDSKTWTPARIEHDKIEATVAPRKEECKVKLDIRDSALIRAKVRRELDGNVLCDLIELDFSSGSARTIFSGRVGAIAWEGPVTTITVELWGGLVGRQLPSRLKSRDCPFCLFSAACGVVMSGWGSTGPYSGYFDVAGEGRKYKLSGLTSANAHYTAFTLAHPNPAQASDGILNWGYWAGGIVIAGSGVTRQVRPCLFSAQKVGGEVHFRTLTPLRLGEGWLKEGDPVTVYPGCDGSMTTCDGKFVNKDNFGGDPFTPAFITEAQLNAGASGK